MDYNDYKLSLRMAGENHRMDLPSTFDRRNFDKTLNKQLVLDDSLTSDELISITVIANSFLQPSLFSSMLKHKNMDSGVVGYWLNNTGELNGSTHYEQFFKSILRNHEKLITPQLVKIALNHYEISMTVAVLENPTAVSMVNSTDIIEILRNNVGDDYFVDRVSNLLHLKKMYIKVYEYYKIDKFLPSEIKDTFLF